MKINYKTQNEILYLLLNVQTVSKRVVYRTNNNINDLPVRKYYFSTKTKNAVKPCARISSGAFNL
jgi:hypothetical protein